MNVRVMLALALMALVAACAQTGGGSASTLDAWREDFTNLPNGGPPVGADGLYNNMGSCPGEGCSISTWQRLTEPAALREQPVRTARAIATLSEGEWVRAENSVHRVRPSRGVVVDEAQAQYNSNGRRTLRLGDVVYAIDYEGEGFVTLRRRGGNLLSWYDSGEEDGGIRWDPRDEAQTEADQQGGAGFWLQVRRDNGQVGWADAGVMECLGSMDPTEACSARNAQ